MTSVLRHIRGCTVYNLDKETKKMEGRGTKQKLSKVWFSYSKKTDELATCNICERDISCKGDARVIW